MMTKASNVLESSVVPIESSKKVGIKKFSTNNFRDAVCSIAQVRHLYLFSLAATFLI
jgi:hypothetical protein